ncbi:hypothetical protein F5Y11DRAFT_342680 [Daldinia sp. FL1419]|nr:hypothetical protein F5Y11DRAFT_342680 [Daldinia sp. FL1419]
MCAQSWSSLSSLVFFSNVGTGLVWCIFRSTLHTEKVPSHHHTNNHTDTVRDHATPLARNLLGEVKRGSDIHVCPDNSRKCQAK